MRTRGGEAEVTVEIGDRPDATLADIAEVVRGRDADDGLGRWSVDRERDPMATAGLRRGGVLDLRPRSPEPR